MASKYSQLQVAAQLVYWVTSGCLDEAEEATADGNTTIGEIAVELGHIAIRLTQLSEIIAG